MSGLLSRPERKTSEAIAYLRDQGRQGPQKLVGHVPWGRRPLLAMSARQVGSDLGESDAVLVFDPSAFAEEGTESVGVTRQRCGRLGEVGNRRVGAFLASASRQGHALVDVRPDLPEQWAKGRPRREAAGGPTAVKVRARQRPAPEMPDEWGDDLPHARVAGDDELGRPSGPRRDLRGRGERYLSNAAPEAPLEELARVAEAAHRIEECLERAEGEAGSADDRVRNRIARHHHQALSLLAAWFLTREARRGKRPDPRVDDAATAAVDRWADRGTPRREHPALAVPPQHPPAMPQRAGQVLSPSFA
jgi:DDE superfamily endonuclease